MEKIILIIPWLLFISCTNDMDKPDAFGNFQAKEYMVSAEVSGKVVYKNFEEGSLINPDQSVAIIDTTQLSLQKSELVAKAKSIRASKVNIQAQIDVLKKQKEVLEKDYNRVKNMLNDGAATQKQLEDIEGKMDVLDKQMASVQTNLLSIDAEVEAIQSSIEKVNDLIDKATIHPPIKGTVLESFIEEGEIAVTGKPLFKMANMEDMELMAYISGDQLTSVKLGQQVLVQVDALEGEYLQFLGKISWISPEAEFTPKNIQTKEERISQVYGMKILVESGGEIKINMPAEVYFNQTAK